MNESDIQMFGTMLEQKGLTHAEIDVWFEHQGVKGMKWGVRRAEARAEKGPDRFGNRHNKSAQRRVDRVSRVASGTASKGDKARALLLDVPLQDIITEGGLRGGAANALDRSKRVQNKVNVGKKNVTDILNRIGGVDIRELNFDYTP